MKQCQQKSNEPAIKASKFECNDARFSFETVEEPAIKASKFECNDAEEVLEEYQESDEDKKNIAQANDLFMESEFERAIFYWEKAAKNGSPRAMHNLAVFMLSKKNYKAAMAYLESAKKYNYGPVYRLLGILSMCCFDEYGDVKDYVDDTIAYVKRAQVLGCWNECLMGLYTFSLLGGELENPQKVNLSLVEKILIHARLMEYTKRKFLKKECHYIWCCDYSSFIMEIEKIRGKKNLCQEQICQTLNKEAIQSGYPVSFKVLTDEQSIEIEKLFTWEQDEKINIFNTLVADVEEDDDYLDFDTSDMEMYVTGILESGLVDVI